MVQYIIILSIVLAIIGIIVKRPRPGVYLYKAACLVLLLPGLVFALFFSLRGLDVTSLNIALHPWREYVLWRFLFATGVTFVLFAVSQIPFLFIRKLSKNEKQRIIKVEGTIYLCLLAIGTGLLYYVVQEHDYAENRIITQIEDYRKAHGQYPDRINPTAFQSGDIIAPDSLSVRYWHDNDEFTFLAENIYGKYVYDSRTGLWSDIPNDESEKDRLIAMSIDADDIIFTDYKKVAAYGVSETDFFALSQSQYERARQVLTQYFTDSIQPFDNGEYLIEHSDGWVEYKPYPYDQYIRQYFGHKDSTGQTYVVVILISKKELEHFKEYFNESRNPDELFFMDDGGSDEIDVLINLDDGKLVKFQVHQEA